MPEITTWGHLPALAVVLVILFWIKEPEEPDRLCHGRTSIRDDWAKLSDEFIGFLGALLLFTLGNSTDAFILLLLSNAGIPTAWVAVIWGLQHVIKSTAAYFGGVLTDTWGPRRILLARWFFYAAVQAAFAFGHSPGFLVAVFLAYGIYFGLAEPSERAWVAKMAPQEIRGSCMGLYHGVIGISALPASVLFGILWKFFGTTAAFLTGSALAFAAAGVILGIRNLPQCKRYID